MAISRSVMIQKFSVMVFSSLVVASVMVLGGCAKYKPKALAKPVAETVENNNIKASAQLLSKSDCRYYFSRNIGKKGYQPVQLYVQNNSDQAVVLDTSSINMPVENKDHVASLLHLDMTPRVAGWGIATLFVWPFIIPTIVEAVKVPKANRALDDDFESRALDMNSRVSIKPHSTLNKVFFVRKENVSDVLEFDLKDTETDMVTNFGINV